MTTKEFFQKERESQLLINKFYKSQGWMFDRSTAGEAYDVIIEGFKIEEKFRYEDYGDFLVEVIQDVNTCNMGWFYKTQSDRIFYIVRDEILYSIDWIKFKNWLKANYTKLKIKSRVSIQGYGLTVNIAIKWTDLPDYLYKKFEIDINQLTLL